MTVWELELLFEGVREEGKSVQLQTRQREKGNVLRLLVAVTPSLVSFTRFEFRPCQPE